MPRPIALFGTGSDVGKSVLTAAVCRILADRGLRVAPYKAQNMSNNAGVAPDGGELGRAQVVQAECARAIPHVDMNPVLLKPSSERRSQVVVLGEVLGEADAASYFRDTSALRAVATAAYDRLAARYEQIVLEGAGSCAEVNLRARDFVNFDAAHHADAEVWLVADIHKGGVFGQVVGTLAVMPEADRERVTGLVVNRFRGDVSLFEDGVRWLEARTGLPVRAVVPWFRDIRVEDEDGLPPQAAIDPPTHRRGARLTVGVLRLPRIANFTDVAAFERVPGVEVHWLSRPRELEGYDLVLLPGTKNTRADLDWLHQTGWSAALRRHAERGGALIGLCGGYQALGRVVADPTGVEGPPGQTPGLGLLDVETELRRPKLVCRTRARWRGPGAPAEGTPAEGYEIHMGRTTRRSGRPVLELEAREGLPAGFAEELPGEDGAASADGRVWGTYLHGVLDRPETLAAVLAQVAPGQDWGEVAALPGPAAARDAEYDKLAAWVDAAFRARGRAVGE